MPCPHGPPARLRAATLVVGLVAIIASPAVTGASESEFRDQLDSRLERGSLTADEALLHRYQRVFAPGDLPAELRTAAAEPVKSATGLEREYRDRRGSLALDVARLIEGYRQADASVAVSVHLTPHFRFEYASSGRDAVPSDDVAPANGIPDVVDWAAEAGEIAWTRYFHDAGFTVPATVGGRVGVTFREMEAFGYTFLDDGVPAIVLHRDFVDFPENSDPAGSRRGAVKVTIAHELKHTSQHAASGWTEGGWLEADATWAEDFVFDEVDDYIRFLSSGSPISHPDDWLPASYEDCLWPQLIAQTEGTAALRAFFERRAVHPEEEVLETYDRVLRAGGSSLPEAVSTLALWCHLTGAQAAGRPEGFRDAELFPTSAPTAMLTDPKETIARSLSALGGHRVLVTPLGRSGHPRVEFVGEGRTQWSVRAVGLDHHGHRRVETIPLSSSAVATHEMEIEWENTVRLDVLVTRLDVGSGTASYTLNVDDQAAVSVEVGGGREDGSFRLEPSRPNPFRDATTIAFELPEAGDVRLAIFDVRGRLVRRLIDGASREAGLHEVRWTGLDEGGRPTAPGVYYFRLEAGSLSSTQRMLRLR